MDVRRSDPTQIFKDHEKRIKALERAPGGTPIYIDKRVLAAADDHVLFQAFPSNLTVLELAWFASLDLASVGDPCYAALLFNGDATHNDPGFDEEEYRWNVGIPNDAVPPSGTFVSVHSNEEYGTLGWIALNEPSYGRVRFPAYSFAGGRWHGDSAIGAQDDTNPGVCSGTRDDAGDGFILSALSMIALTSDGFMTRQQFAVGSWFALTGY